MGSFPKFLYRFIEGKMSKIGLSVKYFAVEVLNASTFKICPDLYGYGIMTYCSISCLLSIPQLSDWKSTRDYGYSIGWVNWTSCWAKVLYPVAVMLMQWKVHDRLFWWWELLWFYWKGTISLCLCRFASCSSCLNVRNDRCANVVWFPATIFFACLIVCSCMPFS